jgi:nucleoside-diphosphate-sugar epimerase
MRILITGMHGFTGKFLSSYLSKIGNDVFNLESDLLDPQSILQELKRKKPDCVIHLAGISSIDNEDISGMYITHIIGSRNLLSCLEASKLELHNIFLASSANLYSNSGEEKIHENSKIELKNDYAVSKFAMESMAALWAKKIPITILRFFNYTGPGQTKNFLIPKIISHFQEGCKTIELGNLDVYREYNDIRNICEIYWKLINSSIPSGEVLNVCTGNTYSVSEIINMVSSLTNTKIEVLKSTKHARRKEPKYLCGDPKKLCQYIGEIQQISLHETLSFMLKYK